MKKNCKNQEIVITRPSTTLIESKFVLTSAPLFEASKHILQSQWLKPHSDAMYMHLFHQMIRQHTKSTPKHIHPHSTPVTSLFIKYFDMPSIAKNIQPCIKSRLSQDNLRPHLNRKVMLRVEQIQKQHEKIKNAALSKIIQMREERPLKNSLTPTFRNKKERLRFNLLENNPPARNRNALGIIEKKSPLKEQYYGLEPIQKPKTLFKHAKRLSNLTNYNNLDFVFKDDLANYPNFPNSTKNSNYYRVGVASQHLTKHTSPQKSLKSSRKSSLKKESMLKKISSQKSVGKRDIKLFRK